MGARLRDRRGVTLIELMVVLAIMAIIVAIALLALWQNVEKRARLSADKGTAAALRSAVAIYYSKHDGSFPPSRALLNTLVVPNPLVFQCPSGSYTYNATEGAVALTINDDSLC